MKHTLKRQGFETRIGLAAVALLLCATQAFAIYGVWRRTARRVAVVGTTVAVSSAASASAAASQSAAAQSEANTAAAAQAAASASQASAAAAQAAAAKATAPAASAGKTPQQQLEELQSLYKQGLISESDYNAAKAKILAQISQ
jgi:hypothetical protein